MIVKNSVLIFLFGACILLAIQSANGEVKKSVNEPQNDSYEHSRKFHNTEDDSYGEDEKKKRNSDLDERARKNELLRGYLEKLILKNKQRADLEASNRNLDDESNDMEEYFDEDDESKEDEDSSDEDDNENRKKKAHLKKKRFRANYKKRSAGLQHRLKRFRAHY